MRILLITFLILPVHLFCQSYSSLTHSIDSIIDNSKIPGISIALMDSEEVFVYSSGLADIEKQIPFDKSTLLNIGSVSKLFTGLALYELINSGKIKLDDAVNSFLPFKIENPYFPKNDILVRHLANHTSSLLDTKYYGRSYVNNGSVNDEGFHEGYLNFISGHDEMSMSEFLKNVYHPTGKWYKKKNFSKTKPGSTNNYTNLNAALVAVIVEQVSGMSFIEYCNEKLFRPLGMNNTSWQHTPADLATRYFPSGIKVPPYKLITYPDGGLVTNIEDLALFMTELRKIYNGSSSYANIQDTHVLFPGDDDNDRIFWGINKKSGNMGHEGSDPGVQTTLTFNIYTKKGYAIICNVNAEDSDELNYQYNAISRLLNAEIIKKAD